MARLPHPPSRLSPPPGASIPSLLSSAGALQVEPSASTSSMNFEAQQETPPRKEPPTGSTRKRDDAPKRGYRACVHCRLRKARCDLGDVNAPSEPPCSRCRREQRNCVFLPSKRRRKTGPDEEIDDKPPIHDVPSSSAVSASTATVHEWTLPQPSTHHANFTTWPEAMPTSLFRDDRPSSSMFAYPELPQRPADFTQLPQASQQDHTKQGPVDPPSIPHSTPGSLDSTSTSALSPSSRTKRRQQGPDATRRIVVANFSNETDALEILANAATDEDKDRGVEDRGEIKGGKRVAWKDEEHKRLGEYLLIRLGVLDEDTLWELVQAYFKHYHPVLPIVLTNRIPRSPQALARLAAEDPFLVACCVAVVSRHHADQRMRVIHERTWAILRDALSDYAFGGIEASVGLVEGVLLLAEFLPREKNPKGGGASRDLSSELLTGRSEGGLHGNDNRRTWSLTGLAIRAAYGLGLDQAALDLEVDRAPEAERARLAFTWCYLYDRTIGLRTGLAFWSRGPAICFTGYSHVSQTGETAARHNFPLMLSPTEVDGHAGTADKAYGRDADCASLIQALMELTQIMTNAHDTLYPNRQRTNDLVRQGAYFRFLDSFRRALDSFKSVWEPKRWRDPVLKELTWCTYEMVRLYVSSFAFQAHVQRAWMRAEEEATAKGHAAAALTPNSAGMPGGAMAPLMGMGGHAAGGVQLFPRGSATSPDALFIYASVDAATEILSICLRLSKQGVLRYLPSRYLTNFVYAGVFSLKSAYSGAQGRGDLAKTRELVDRVCAALVLASPDRDHPASRYGQMLRLLSKKLEELSEQSAVPSRFPSPEPELAPTLPLQPTPNSTWENFIIPSSTDFPSIDTASTDPNGSASLPQTGLEGLFDFDVDVNFNMEGFWDDFTLAEGSGFPFR